VSRVPRALAVFALAFLTVATRSRAQDAPPDAIGRIIGPDLTVESASAEGSGLPSSAPSIYVLPGSIVTVHSGQAQLTLSSGGRLDICGPAKFTVLESSGAITLALNFGKVRVQLPAATPLHIYTPTIIATPLDIGGGPRDVTIGLDLQDSLCVRPISGALQLESQFTGGKIVAPENSEFFLAGGKLTPVAGAAGSCQCVAAENETAAAAVAPAVAAASTKPIPLPPPKPGQYADSSRGASEPPDIEAPPTTYILEIQPPALPPKPPGDREPDRPVARTALPEAAPNRSPVYQVSTPALSYTAPSGLAPSQPSVETLLLVTQARVEPDYEFHGEVLPDFATAMQNALGERPAKATEATGESAASNSSSLSAPPSSEEKKGGFWAKLKRVFGGS
jgi:hypothetical protein